MADPSPGAPNPHHQLGSNSKRAHQEHLGGHQAQQGSAASSLAGGSFSPSWGGKWKQEEKGKQEPGSERQGEAAAPSRCLRIYLSPASQIAAWPFGIIPKHSPPYLLLLNSHLPSSPSRWPIYHLLLRNGSNSDAELLCFMTLDSGWSWDVLTAP